MSIALPEFTPAQESLFLTLGSRALDSRLPRPFLGDAMADELIATTGYRLDKFPTLSTRALDERSKVFDVAVRTKRLDELVHRFVTRHPGAVVLELGAGLDTRMFRIDAPSTVQWYDVDFPDVIELRQRLLPPSANGHGVGADLTDRGWLDAIPADPPVMIVADGVFPFLTQDEFVTLLDRLTNHFKGGELALNVYTTYGIWVLKHTRAMRAIAADVVNPGVNNPRQPEHWVDRLTLLDEIFSTRAPEVADMPMIGRIASRLAARSAKLSRRMATAVWHYGF